MSRTNLNPNGGFETDLTGWNDYQTRGSLTRVTTEHMFGSAAAKSTCTTGGGGGSEDFGVWRIVGVVPGQPYTHSVYVKGEGTSIGKTIICYVQDNSTWTHVFTLTGAWQRIDVYTGYPGAPVTVVNGNLNIFILQINALVGDVFYVDGDQLEYGSAATDYIETDGHPVTVESVPLMPHGIASGAVG